MSIAISESDGGGKEKTKKQVKKMNDTIGDDITAAIEEWWLEVIQTARELAEPHDTGSLRDSIRTEDASFAQSEFMVVEETGEELVNKILVAGDYEHLNRYGKPSAEYAMAIHDGHLTTGGGYVVGRFFLSEALAIHENELMEILSRKVDKKLEEVTEDC